MVVSSKNNSPKYSKRLEFVFNKSYKNIFSDNIIFRF